MRFETHVIHDKWIFIEHERTGTFFTIESKENTMSPRKWEKDDKTYKLICCPSKPKYSENHESSECWSEVEDLSELEIGEIAYMNILLKRLFRREILISNKTIGQRGVSLTY